MKSKLIVSILAVFFTAVSVFSQNAVTAKPLTPLLPPKEIRVNKIEVFRGEVRYEINLGNNSSCARFITDGAGVLTEVHVVLDDHWAVQVARKDGEWVFGNDVTRPVGFDIKLWSAFFNKVASVKITISSYAGHISQEEKEWEFVGFTFLQNKRLVALRAVGSEEVRMIPEGEFAVLPRNGSRLRLGSLDGKFYPVEQIKSQDQRTFAAVVVSESRPSL